MGNSHMTELFVALAAMVKPREWADATTSDVARCSRCVSSNRSFWSEHLMATVGNGTTQAQVLALTNIKDVRPGRGGQFADMHLAQPYLVEEMHAIGFIPTVVAFTTWNDRGRESVNLTAQELLWRKAWPGVRTLKVHSWSEPPSPLSSAPRGWPDAGKPSASTFDARVGLAGACGAEGGGCDEKIRNHQCLPGPLLGIMPRFVKALGGDCERPATHDIT